MRNHRNLTMVEKRILNMRVKFMDKIIAHLITINKNYMNTWKRT